MKRFSYKGYIKIIIHQNSALFDVKMQHILYPIRLEVSILPKIKDYILDNIDLLSREIYKRLIERGLDINIHQKQIHFWWTKFGKNRYKRDKDPFLSVQK